MQDDYLNNYLNCRFLPFFRWLVLAILAASVIYVIIEYLVF